MKFKIMSITAEYIKQYNIAVDVVAKEKKYLAFLTGPSIDMSMDFVYQNKKLGFATEGLHLNAIRIDGKYENYISMALLLDT